MVCGWWFGCLVIGCCLSLVDGGWSTLVVVVVVAGCWLLEAC